MVATDVTYLSQDVHEPSESDEWDCYCTGKGHVSYETDGCEFEPLRNGSDGRHYLGLVIHTDEGFKLEVIDALSNCQVRTVVCDGEVIGALRFEWAKRSVLGDYKWPHHYTAHVLMTNLTSRYKSFVEVDEALRLRDGMMAVYHSYFNL